MATPEKRKGRPTGYWYGEFDRRHQGGERWRERFETKREAEGWEAYVRSTGERPPWSSKCASGHTFGSVAAECKAAGGPKGAWKAGRYRGIDRLLDWLCSIKLGRMPIGAIDYKGLQGLVADLEKRPGKSREVRMSSGTINRYLSAVSAVLTFAQAAGYITAKPQVPWQREPKQARFWWLTKPQEQAVCKALMSEGYAVEALCVLALARTGLRWGEFSSLEPAQVEDNWLRLWKTKTDTPRSVPIKPDLARELRAIVAAKALPNYITLVTRFKRACKVCGYAPELSLHCLRHTTATRLVQANVALPKVQRLMGHKSINTTMRYLHVQDDDLAEAAENLYPQGGETAQDTSVLEFPTRVQNQ